MVECSQKAIAWTLKVLGVLVCVFMGANGVLRFIKKGKTKTETFVVVYYIVAVYLIIFAILGILTMFINKLKWLFGFLDMENWKARGFYFIFCGLLMFDWKVINEIICCAAMVAIGVIYILCACQTRVESKSVESNKVTS